MALTRRDFLRRSGGAAALAIGANALWLDAARAEPAGAKAPLLVVIFLRGGADGLQLVSPIGDRAYARRRGGLALGSTLPFVKGFGLHPALGAMQTLVDRRELAVVHAVGMPGATRSHFEAQDRLETGMSSGRVPDDGWLARALRPTAADPTNPNPLGALALGERLPLSLRGVGSFAIGDAGSFGLPGASGAARQALVASYAEPAEAAQLDGVARAGREALDALAEIEDLELVSARDARSRRARRAATSLAERAKQARRLVEAGLPIRALCFDSDGWDTHRAQDSGATSRRVADLGEAVSGLVEGLREKRWVQVVVMTEFGRTLAPNGSGGTDHGTGSVMWLAGRGVRGGLHGDWPGLAESALREGRDLEAANDPRDVLHAALRRHLGAPPDDAVFPGFEPRGLALHGV